MNVLAPFPVPPDQAGQTLAAVLRSRLPGQSWTRVRALVASRRVKVRGEPCLDDARRLKEGDTVELLATPLPRPRDASSLIVRHLDAHIVVVEKPAGINTVRHPAEREWAEGRRKLSPTLEDLVSDAIGRGPRLRIVHRLDKETSGLVVFARTHDGERGLGKQFRDHTVKRRYLALVPGSVRPGTIRSTLVRDRGDGRRGSGDGGKEAVTHIAIEEVMGEYTLVSCRLETGRTHQIRIHLSERGTPVCGDRVYSHKPDGGLYPDASGAPRLMLHAVELGFQHPVMEQAMHWEMPPPVDMLRVLERLRGSG